MRIGFLEPERATDAKGGVSLLETPKAKVSRTATCCVDNWNGSFNGFFDWFLTGYCTVRIPQCKGLYKSNTAVGV